MGEEGGMTPAGILTARRCSYDRVSGKKLVAAQPREEVVGRKGEGEGETLTTWTRRRSSNSGSSKAPPGPAPLQKTARPSVAAAVGMARTRRKRCWRGEWSWKRDRQVAVNSEAAVEGGWAGMAADCMEQGEVLVAIDPRGGSCEPPIRARG